MGKQVVSDGAPIRLFLDKELNQFSLYACRGAGKGCKRNEFRDPTSQKACEDCVLTRNTETIRELQDRLA
jgi:hypothetical protein